MTSSFIGQRQIQSPTWTSKIVQGLANRGVVPKSLRAAVPARCRAGGDAPLPENPSKTALKSLPKARLQVELEARGLLAAGNKPVLVDRLHEALASQPAGGVMAQRAAKADTPAAANEELLDLRNKVAELDEELGAMQALLRDANGARQAEREQLEALQGQVADLQAGWAADRRALDDAVESAQTVAESEEEVRELQGRVVQLGERVVKMQTLVKEKDEQVAELTRKLREARPAFAMAGAAGAAPSLDSMLAGMDFGGAGGVLPSAAPSRSGRDLEAAVSAQAAPTSWPLEAPPTPSKEFRSDILQQPGVLGVTLAAGSLAAADVSSAVWSSMRRLAPPEQRQALDAAAVAAVGSVTAAAAYFMSQGGSA